MNTEQRLGFEAKHTPRADVRWSQSANQYLPYRASGTFASALQNALWQGYQSALEDRQGEAVATLDSWKHVANEWADTACNGITWLKNIRDGISTCEVAIANMEVCIAHCREVSDAANTSPQPAQSQQGEAVAHILPAELKRLQEARDANLGLSHAYVFANAARNGCGPTVPLFTSPQPAQPDQWNAAIEAVDAVLLQQQEAYESIEAKQFVGEYKGIRKAILALRKGA